MKKITIILAVSVAFPVFSWSVSDQTVVLPQKTTQALLSKSIQETDPRVLSSSEEKSYAGEDFFFQKKPTKLSDEEKDVIDYRESLALLKSGSEVQAERILSNLVMRSPDFHLARKELVALYLRQEALLDAEKLLHVGLEIERSHPEFLRMMAIVCEKRQEFDKALSLLKRVPNSRKKEKNHLVLLGHIYQQKGDYSLARQQYLQLLELEPRNSLWLLGVSVALDSEGKKEAALEGYRRLLSEGKIEVSLLEHARERVRKLQE